MNSKTISYKIAAIAIITLLAAPSILTSFAFGLPAGADAASWYKTVPGVLATDKYSLYPYQKKSLTIGFSKFGEMINALPTQRVGLQYGDRDPFAPPAGSSEPAGIPQRKWFQGWLINITYIHAVASPNERCVWAECMQAAIDTSTFGNDWVRVDHTQVNVVGGKKTGSNTDACEDPADKGVFLTSDGLDYIPGQVDGGRKTNGSAVTMPIQVLYDGPRRYVAQVETIISDVLDDSVQPYPTEPLVKIVFTIDFNKVKKEVNVLKDIKLLFVKFQYGVKEITTSNKTTHNGEYTDCHNYNYTGGYQDGFQGMYVQFSNRGEWDLGPTPVFDSYAHFFTDGPGENKSALAGGFNKVGGAKGWQGWGFTTDEGLTTVYDREYALIRTAPPNALARWGIEPDKEGLDTYDLAQIISSDLKYVGFAGFWPSLSDWSIDGVTDNLWWRSIAAEDIHREDCKVEPYTSPFVIGEWDFILTPNPKYDPVNKLEGDVQFRGVTVYGVTDLNRGLDNTVGNEIDSYDYADGVAVGDGDDMNRLVGAMNIVDREVYYQLSEVYRPWDLKKATTGYYAMEETIDNEQCDCGTEEKSERHVIIEDVTLASSVNLLATWPNSYWADWGVPFYSRVYRDISAPDGIIGNDQAEVGEWFAYNTFAENVLLNNELLVRGKDYVIEGDTLQYVDGPLSGQYLVNANISFTSPVSGHLKILYSVCDPAYEWIAVGAKAASVDSVGAAMVSEAFSWNQEITVQWGSLDRKDTTAGETVPYLMSKVGEGWEVNDYYYNNAGDYRTALKDDWSTTVPIASSNIIGVGGPEINLIAQYFNEFSPVIYRGQFGWPLSDLLPVSGWGGNKGNSTTNGPYAGKGYAVITTYQDINGTVGFMVWGMTGDDSFWASEALWNTGWVDNKPGLDIYKMIRVDDPSLGVGEIYGNGNGDLDSKDPIIPVHLSVIKYWMVREGWSMEELSLHLTAEMIAHAEDRLVNAMGKDWPIPLVDFLAYWENCGITSLVLSIDYTNMSQYGDVHPIITIVEELGTKTEKPQHPDP